MARKNTQSDSLYSRRFRAAMLAARPDFVPPAPRRKVTTLGEFLGEWRTRNHINTRPPYQRQDDAWTTEMKQGLIAACINEGHGLGDIRLVRESADGNSWNILDGLQRYSCVTGFFSGRLGQETVCLHDASNLASTVDVTFKQLCMINRGRLLKNFLDAPVNLVLYPHMSLDEQSLLFVSFNRTGRSLSYEEQAYGPAFFARQLFRYFFDTVFMSRLSAHLPKNTAGGMRYKDVRAIHELLLLAAGDSLVAGRTDFAARNVGWSSLSDHAFAAHYSLVLSLKHDDTAGDRVTEAAVSRLGLAGLAGSLRRTADAFAAILDRVRVIQPRRPRGDHRHLIDTLAYLHDLVDRGRTTPETLCGKAEAWADLLLKAADQRAEEGITHASTSPSTIWDKYAMLDRMVSTRLGVDPARPQTWSRPGGTARKAS